MPITYLLALAYCDVCDEHIERRKYIGHLRSVKHSSKLELTSENGIISVQTAFQSRICTFRLFSDNHHIVLQNFMNEIKKNFVMVLGKELNKFPAVKCHVELFSNYIKEDIQDVKSFIVPNVIVTLGSDLEELFSRFIEAIESKIYDFEERGSGKLIYFKM